MAAVTTPLERLCAHRGVTVPELTTAALTGLAAALDLRAAEDEVPPGSDAGSSYELGELMWDLLPLSAEDLERVAAFA